MFFSLISQETHYRLKLVTGMQEGQVFELPAGREVVVGRAEGADILLGNDTRVSRRHARFNVAGNQLIIIDLGSRNGTYVNDARVLRARLKEGDRVRIGACVLEVQVVSDGNGHGDQNEHGRHRAPQPAVRGEGGRLEETPLLELLRRWMNSRRSGTVVVRSAAGTGRLHLNDGRVSFAELDDHPHYIPRKVLFRLLTWTTGSFQVESPLPNQVALELSDSPSELLEEAVNYIEELNRLRDQLPPPDASMLVPTPPPADVRNLTYGEAEVYQLVIKHGTLHSVLDHYQGADLEACRHFESLLRQGFIVVV